MTLGRAGPEAGAFLLAALLLVGAETARGAPPTPSRPTQEATSTDGTPAVQVQVRGLGRRMRRNVRHHLSITDLTAGGALEERVRRLHERAPDEIRSALEPFGLYRPEIQASLEPRGESRWLATYRVDPGPVVTVRDLDLRVAGPTSLDNILADVAGESRLRPGSPLLHAEYEGLKSRLLRTARSRGYLDASWDTSRVEVTAGTGTARVRLHLVAGPRYRYGPVRYTDTTTFEADFLRSFSPVQEGDPYSLPELVAFQGRLAGSGYFRTAEVDARRDSARDLRVPVSVRIEARPRTVLSFGLGASTDLGPRASAGWQARWLNGKGHRVAAEARAALQRQTASLRYALPVGTPGYEDLVFTAGFRRDDFEGILFRTLSAAAGLLHQRGAWQEAVQVQAEREWFEVAGEERTATLVLPRVGWSRSSRDEALAPTRAGRVSVDLQGTAPALGSNTSFLQGQVSAGLIRSPYQGGRILLRGEVGLTAAGRLEELPGSARLFAGGDQSVRGYAYRSLAPVDDDGNLLGGRHLSVASAEYEQRLFGPFAAAAFVDAGTAARQLDGLADPSVGAGAGLRWRSPLGPVRVDLALALSRPGPPARLHLVVGPDL